VVREEAVQSPLDPIPPLFQQFGFGCPILCLGRLPRGGECLLPRSPVDVCEEQLQERPLQGRRIEKHIVTSRYVRLHAGRASVPDFEPLFAVVIPDVSLPPALAASQEAAENGGFPLFSRPTRPNAQLALRLLPHSDAD